MEFTKEDTLCMKGIAILIMFFHHNYLGPDRWLDSPINFFPFSEANIIYIAQFFKVCVGMFVFLTGYGMFVSAKKRVKNDLGMREYVLNRYLTLIFNYMLIFLLVHILSAPTGRFSKVYGKGLYSVVYFFIDGIGLAHLLETPTFCATWWYMSLATILILIFPIFSKLLLKYQGSLLALTICLPMALKLPNSDLLRWLFCYCLGMYCAEHNLFVKFKEKYMKNCALIKFFIFILMVAGLLLIIKFRQSEGFGIKLLYLWEGLAPAYIILMSYVFIVNHGILARILKFLGKHSMNMFLIHTMFRAVYFHDFIYSFYYAWVDYLVLIIVSVLCSVAIETMKKVISFNEKSLRLRSFIIKNVKIK